MVDNTSTDLPTTIHGALKQWHEPHSTDSPFSEWHIYKQALRKADGDIRAAVNQIIFMGILELEKSNEREAQILRLRFLEELTIKEVAGNLNLGSQTIQNNQGEAFNHLASILQSEEEKEYAAHQKIQEERLEYPSTLPLVGVEEHLAKLTPLLTKIEPPWLLAISGIGGIGKTTLADALVRQIIMKNAVEEIGWITARKQILNPGGAIQSVDIPILTPDALVEALSGQLLEDVPRPDKFSMRTVLPILKHHLKSIPHLIVIDNLETIIDIESLISILQQLANPTKFILTSREHLPSIPDLYYFPVPELTQPHAVTLIQHEARRRNIQSLIETSNDTLEPIYQTVGGNPLALRLVVGQTHFHSLDVILHNLRSAKGKKAEDLYEFIYRHAWDQLDELRKNVLLAMPLVTSHGATLKYLSKLCELDVDELIDPLETLISLNLVDARGSVNERRYTIHNLTRAFLHERVLQW